MVAAPPPGSEPGRWSKYLIGAVFLGPALFMLALWMVYPVVYTIVRSFFGPHGFLGTWVGIDNYRTLFSDQTLRTAIKNNIIWVAVVPALVTAIGLLFGGFYVLLATPLLAVLVTLIDVIVRDKDPAEEDTPTVLFAKESTGR